MWPRSVNLMALLIKFIIICRSLPASPIRRSGVPSSVSKFSVKFLRRADTLSNLIMPVKTSDKLKGAQYKVNLFASILEKSSTSFIMSRSASADSRATDTNSRWSGANSVARASSVMPMIPFIGVLISWLILARNWLLA